MPARKKPARFPSEAVRDDRPRKDLGGLSIPEALGIDLSPALRPTELTELERIVDAATPEQFQQEFSKMVRKLMVRGLREMPVPRSLKELQVLYDMFRKSTGIEARDKNGGGAVASGFLPRVVGRRALVVAETVEEVPTEGEPPVPEIDAAESGAVPEIDAADPLKGFEL